MLNRLLLVCLCLALPARICASAEAKIEFNRDIRPILAAKCFACHGPDEDKRKADLRLDIRAEAIKEAITPGKPEASELVKRICSPDSDEVMPPPSSPKPLADDERDVLRRWITQGAEYQEHWAFLPIKRPALPETGLANQKSVIGNPIDAFIRAELEKHNLKPSPEADPVTLIRRVSLDLVGLPPTPDEVAAFVSEFQSSRDAYASLVDRLLASPHFGERWARHWLDGARYADSNGFLGDGLRPNAYRYRDWVIKAFNDDLPFDQFTIQQIAGDVLNAPAGTGFHRNAALNTEAGVDKEEARYQNLVDRVNTVGRVWMGLTIGCAQCHTHKYDPITIIDYYSFFAFFDNTEDRDDAKTKAPALAEVAKDRRRTYVHMAGDYTRRGPDVEPASLTALPRMQRDSQAAPSRLDLAKWLISPAHPLTSRVAVNHIWSKLFGTGIVSTADDFGTSGAAPSHPELLDWLASEFMNKGWSRKQLIKLIVMSETYRRTSFPTRSSNANEIENSFYVDPLNRLLSRQSRIRLDAEILRDSALAVSGLLKPTIGGPSFRPPLPEDVFDVGRSSNWQASPGDEIYRRSLYIITLRSVLYPTLTTFDAPDAADSCVRRERSNTPLQSLAMMNDGVFVESAQALAGRTIREGSGDEVEQLRHLFMRCLSREPRAEELQRLVAFHAEQKKSLQSGGGDMRLLLGSQASSVPTQQVVETAALVAVARVLVNLDEFINRP